MKLQFAAGGAPRTWPGYEPRRQAPCPIARRCPGRGSAMEPKGFYSLRRAAHSAHAALPAAFRCISPYLQVFTCIHPPRHHGITLRSHVSLHVSDGLWARLWCCCWQRPAPRAILAPTATQHNSPTHLFVRLLKERRFRWGSPIVAPFGGRGAPPVRFQIAQRAHGFEMCALGRKVKGPPRCSATGAVVRSNLEMLPFAPGRTIDCRDLGRAQETQVQAPGRGFWFPGRQAVAQTGRRRDRGNGQK